MKTKETESSWLISTKDLIATTSFRKSLKRLIRTRFRRPSAQMCFMWWSIYLIRKKEKEEYSLIPQVHHQKVITITIRCQTFRIVRSALLVQKLTQNVSMYRHLVIHQVHRRERTKIRCWEKMIRTLKKWRSEWSFHKYLYTWMKHKLSKASICMLSSYNHIGWVFFHTSTRKTTWMIKIVSSVSNFLR